MAYGPYDESSKKSGHPVVDKSNDDCAAGRYVEPTFKLLHDGLFKEHSLLWSPYIGLGMPLLADIGTACLNPLSWLAWIPNPSPQSIVSFRLANLFCAGMLMFIFLRQFLTFLPCQLGALAYMFNGYFMLYLYMPDITGCAIMPGLFFSIENLIRKRCFLSVLFLACFTALSLAACGIPEFTLLSLTSGGVYFILRLLSHSLRAHTLRADLACYCGASLLGFMLAAPVLLPLAEFLSQSYNAHQRPEHSLLAGEEFFPAFLAHAINSLSPYIYVPHLRCDITMVSNSNYKGFVGYWGITVFFLASIAVCETFFRLIYRSNARRSHRELLTLFCLSLWLILLAKRFGCPLVQWIGFLPLFNLVLFWKYAEPVIAFLVAVLASIGFSWLSARSVRQRLFFNCFLGVATVYASLIFIDLHLQLQSCQAYYLCVAAITMILLIACFALGTAALYSTKHRSQALIALMLLATSELMLNYAGPSLTFCTAAPRKPNVFEGAPFIDFLLAQKRTAVNDRIAAMDSVLVPRWAAAFGLYDIRDVSAIYPRRYLPFIRAFVYGNEKISPACGIWMPINYVYPRNLTEEFWGSEPEADPLVNLKHAQMIVRLWQLTSTRFVVRDLMHDRLIPEWLAQQISWKPAKVYSKEVNIFRLPQVLPRACLYHSICVDKNSSDGLKRLIDQAFNPFQRAIIEADELKTSEQQSLDELLSAKNTNAAESQEITRYKADLVEISVRSLKPGLLVLNDNFYPGWRAYLDGKEVPILHANYLFRGVIVSAGAHRLLFKYQPLSMLIGMIIFVLAIMVMLAVWLSGLAKEIATAAGRSPGRNFENSSQQ